MQNLRSAKAIECAGPPHGKIRSLLQSLQDSRYSSTDALAGSQLMFPDSHNGEALALEGAGYAPRASHISGDLCGPVAPILNWKTQAMLAPVPETPVNEDQDPPPTKEEVRFTQEMTGVEAPTCDGPAHQRHSKPYLGGSVPRRADFSHQCTAGFLCKRIQTVTSSGRNGRCGNIG